jgi:P450-derived glycosyltransferase activator
MPVDSGLGRRLQLIQGLQWLYGANGDPYATMLRGFDEDLVPLYEKLRQRGALWTAETGTWVTARYDVGAELLGHRSLGTGSVGERPAVQQIMSWDADATDLDPVAAEELRALTGPALTPESVRQRYDRALDLVGEEFDLVSEVAQRVAVEVLADRYGFTGADRTRLVSRCGEIVIAPDSLLCPQRLEPTYRLLDALDDLRALFDGQPAGLAHAVFGVRVSADLVAKAVTALTESPGQWEKLVADPAGVSTVVQETLRYDPPVHVHVAIAQAELEMSGQTIPAGSQVAVVLAAANRDPEVFTEPGRFDPRRAEAAPLTAGGPFDVVLPLAKLHAETALRALVARFPRLRGGPALRRGRAPVTRGLLRLPLHANGNGA